VAISSFDVSSASQWDRPASLNAIWILCLDLSLVENTAQEEQLKTLIEVKRMLSGFMSRLSGADG